MQATRDDFLESDWEAVIARSSDKECNYYRSHIFQKARDGKDANDQKTEELFGLLGDICSFHLRRDSPDQPFGPMMTSPQGRTAIPEDLDEDQIIFLNGIVRDVTDADLRARVADVLWVLRRDYKLGEVAVSAYLESVVTLEDPKNWVATNDRITRALQIARLMGRNAQSYSLVVRHIEEVLARCNGEDPFFLSARMMALLQDCRTGDSAKYAALSEKLALKGEAERDWDRARDYWELKLNGIALRRKKSSNVPPKFLPPKPTWSNQRRTSAAIRQAILLPVLFFRRRSRRFVEWATQKLVYNNCIRGFSITKRSQLQSCASSLMTST
jgi:hypothetical protein